MRACCCAAGVDQAPAGACLIAAAAASGGRRQLRPPTAGLRAHSLHHFHFHHPPPPRPALRRRSCGDSFEVWCVSPAFEGKRLLDRHKAVARALAPLMTEIHALSIKQSKTPAEVEKAAAAAATS